MQKQEIQNVNLILNSEEGIKPIQNYSGTGFLTKDSSGFHFTERKRYTRTRNIRVAKFDEGTYIMFEPHTGMYKMQVYLTQSEMTQKGAIAKIAPMFKEAKEGGYL